MQFKVNKDDVVRLLEVIMITNQTEEGIDVTGQNVSEKASDMLLTMTRLPVEWCTVILSEEEALFLSEHY